MSARTMHDDEIDVDDAVVRRLLRGQFPQWADLPLTLVDSMGTVNALFRLGNDLVVPLPRTPRWHDIDAEVRCLGRIAGCLPLVVPRVVAIGHPDGEYPWKWGVFRWIEGETWSIDAIEDPRVAARQLAEFVRALHAIEPSGGPRASRDRRRTMTAENDRFRKAADAARGLVDTDALIAAWDEACQAPGWAGPPVWTHRDLLPANVLAHQGRLHAVIDWAGAGVGDPARDLTPAWTLFEGESRQEFRAMLPFDDAAWMRARGYALRRIYNVAYYAETNPRFSGRRRAHPRASAGRVTRRRGALTRPGVGAQPCQRG